MSAPTGFGGRLSILHRTVATPYLPALLRNSDLVKPSGILTKICPVPGSMTSTATEGTTPLSAAEQAHLHRERREKKILAQGTSRLEKISSLQGGATAREALSSTPHPDPPEHDISFDNALSSPETALSLGASTTSPYTTRCAFSPGRNVFAVDGGDEDPFNMLGGGNDPMANILEELRNDLMMKLLLKNPLFEHLAGSGGGAAARDGLSRDSSSDDLNQLAERLNQQLFGPGTASQFPNGGSAVTEEVVSSDTSVWMWKLLRVIGVVTVLYYLWIQIEDIHFSRAMDISLGIVRPFY
jgi:GET complex subunit GET2